MDECGLRRTYAEATVGRDADTFSIFWANLDNIYITGKLENSGV